MTISLPHPHLRIGQRLAAGYGFVIALLIATALVGMLKLGSLSAVTDDALKDKYPNTLLVNRLIGELGTIARAMRNTLIMTEPGQVEQQLAEIQRAKRKMADALTLLRQRVRDPHGKELVQQIDIIGSAYIVNQEEFVTLLGQGRRGEAKNLLLVDLNPYQSDYFDALDEMQRFEGKLMDEARNDIAQSYQRARLVIMTATVSAALLSIGITFHISRSLLRQLGGEPDYASDIARRIAADDLGSEIAIRTGDHASLLFAMKVMRDKLVERRDALQEANAELEQSVESLLRTQEDLVRSEKLAALGSLVAGVAHELNTPLGNSLLAASALVDHTSGFERECAAGITRSSLASYVAEVKQAGAIVMRNLQRADELVASFKQVAVDRASAQAREFQLHDVVGEIILTLWPSLKKSGVAISHDVPAGIVMRSYPGPLGQVITNLINNAVLHGFDGRPGGSVTVGARTLGDDWVELTVRDDGMGIAPEILGRIYDPFFTTKMGRGGSGLGLNIVYNMVHGVLGGRIAAFSEPGNGACFTLTLPVKSSGAG